MISVLVADDHGVVREGLQRVFEAEEDISVCAEAADGQEALEQYRNVLVQIPSDTLARMDAGDARVSGLLSTHSHEFHYVRAHANMGQLLFREGKTDAAIAHYARALRVFPSYEPVVVMMKNALKAKGVAEAELEREMTRILRER